MARLASPERAKTAEELRLDEAREKGVPWKQWGPYLSERQWGTVREDYSENGDAWNYISHDQARSRDLPKPQKEEERRRARQFRRFSRCVASAQITVRNPYGLALDISPSRVLAKLENGRGGILH